MLRIFPTEFYYLDYYHCVKPWIRVIHFFFNLSTLIVPWLNYINILIFILLSYYILISRMSFVQKMLSATAGLLHFSLKKAEIENQPFLNRCCFLQYISQSQSCLLLTIKLSQKRVITFIYL